MDKLNNIVLLIQHYLADYILIILLLGGGVIFTIRLGFIQIRGFKAGWKRTFGGLFSKKGTAGKDGMSSFQALATAIAAQVGTGNIAGAATALAIGGPGAVSYTHLDVYKRQDQRAYRRYRNITGTVYRHFQSAGKRIQSNI